MIASAIPILLAASLVAKLARPPAPSGTGAGRYEWRRNSFTAARRMGRRRAQRNRRKAARR